MRVDPTNPLATARGDKIGDAAFCQISLDTLFFWFKLLAIDISDSNYDYRKRSEIRNDNIF